MTRHIAAAIVALALVTADPVGAQAIHSIVNVDILPNNQVAGKKALEGYLEQAKRDTSLTSIELLEQIDIPNHFIISRTMASKAAYDRHVEQPYVIKFRQFLHPLLGSPWDERLGREVPG